MTYNYSFFYSPYDLNSFTKITLNCQGGKVREKRVQQLKEILALTRNKRFGLLKLGIQENSRNLATDFTDHTDFGGKNEGWLVRLRGLGKMGKKKVVENIQKRSKTFENVRKYSKSWVKRSKNDVKRLKIFENIR